MNGNDTDHFAVRIADDVDIFLKIADFVRPVDHRSSLSRKSLARIRLIKIARMFVCGDLWNELFGNVHIME